MLDGYRRLHVPWYAVRTLVILLAGVGIALRLRQFLYHRSLWRDEVGIAINLLNRNFGSLLSEPLKGDQSAPPGFLVAVRSAVVTFGTDDYTLRLVPLIAGILVVVVAALLARHELRSAAAKVTFVGLVALSPVLIFYSSELKQYSSDALCALLILVGVAYRRSRFGTWLLAATGLFALVFSLPAVFVAAPAALLLLYEAIASSRWRQTIVAGIAWGLGAALHAAYILQAGVERPALITAWRVAGGFPPAPPTSISELLWYPRSFSSLTYLALREVNHALRGFEPAWADPLGWLLALTLVIALFAVIGTCHRTGLVAAGAIFTTLVVSAFEIYPFSSRLVIFLVPLVLFIIAVGVDELARLSSLAAVAVTVLLLSVVVPPAVNVALEPRTDFDMRAALKIVNRGFEAGDAVAVFETHNVFRYYRRMLRSKDVPSVKVTTTAAARPLLDKFKANGNRRLWLVVAHFQNRATALIDELAQAAPVVADWKTPGARVLLFDLSKY
jgi:hypothetical protein